MAAEADGLPFDRHAVPEILQPQLRQYRRLYLARIDLEEARDAADELLTRRIPIPRSSLPTPLLLSLTTALVVAYARPFINSRGRSAIADNIVPGSVVKVLRPSERKMHDLLVAIRNEQVAHSDADPLEISIKLFKDGDSGLLISPRRPFYRDELRLIRRVISKLLNAIEARCESLRSKLPLEVWL